MNLLELFNSLSSKEIREEYVKLYDTENYAKDEVFGIIKEYMYVKSQSQDCGEPDFKIVVSLEKDLSDEEYVDVYGVDENGETLALDFTCWGLLAKAEVENRINISQAELAAHILWEMTYWGFPEQREEKQKKLLESFNPEDYVEIADGIMVSPQVAAQMEKHGELNEILKNLTVNDLVEKGRKF